MKVVLGVLAFIVLGVAGTGCDVSPSAATVNGVSISQSQLNSVLSDVVNHTNNEDEYVACALELQGANLPSSLAGAGGSTVSSELASYELSTLILDELVSQDLARHHRPVGSGDISTAATDLETEFDLAASSSGGQSCLGQLSGRQLLAHLPSSFSTEQVRYLADQEQLATVIAHVDLSAQAVDRYYFTHASDFAETCISDIEVTTQAEAQSILATISSGGASFSTEAQQNSIDTQTAPNGGVVSPCFSTSQIQGSTVLASLASLAPGQVSQPVQATSSSGSTVWLLLRVDSRQELPLAQVRSQIRLSLLSAGSSPLSREFDRLTSRADVTVDPRYGNWNHLRGVVPPVPPSAKYLLSPAADEPGTVSALGG